MKVPSDTEVQSFNVNKVWTADFDESVGCVFSIDSPELHVVVVVDSQALLDGVVVGLVVVGVVVVVVVVVVEVVEVSVVEVSVVSSATGSSVVVASLVGGSSVLFSLSLIPSQSSQLHKCGTSSNNSTTANCAKISLFISDLILNGISLQENIPIFIVSLI